MQKRRLPSGFLTNNTGEPKGEFDGLIKPKFNNSSSYDEINFYSAGDTLYTHRAGTLASANNCIRCSAFLSILVGNVFGNSEGKILAKSVSNSFTTVYTSTSFYYYKCISAPFGKIELLLPLNNAITYAKGEPVLDNY